MTEALPDTAQVVKDLLFEQIEQAEAKYVPIHGYDLTREVARLATGKMEEEVTRSYVSGLLWDLVYAAELDVSVNGRVTIV